MVARILLLVTLLVGWSRELRADDIAPQIQHGALAPVLQSFVDRQIIAGAVALVADREKILDTEAVGFASPTDKIPMRDDALFWLASITKTFTGTSVMILADEGKVNIDDPVEKYLPEFKGQQVAEDKAHPHPPAHPMTVRELLSHTSGIISSNDPSLKRTSVLKEDIAQYAAAPLKWEPGTRYEYNNSGITTLGRIIEVASGMPYADFVKQRLLDPLGMTETTYWPDEALASRLAHTARLNAEKQTLEDIPNQLDKAGFDPPSDRPRVPAIVHSYLGDVRTIYANRYAWPAGGLFSTAYDIVKFGQMMLNGGISHGNRILSPAAFHRMTSNQNENLTVGPKVPYGLCWMVKSHPEEGLSTGSFGHMGALGPVLFIDPTHDLVLILLFESADIQLRGDPKGSEQSKIRTAFFQAAIEKFGKPEAH